MNKKQIRDLCWKAFLSGKSDAPESSFQFYFDIYWNEKKKELKK